MDTLKSFMARVLTFACVRERGMNPASVRIAGGGGKGNPASAGVFLPQGIASGKTASDQPCFAVFRCGL